MPKYVNGDMFRIFINISIGCNCICSYCYLPSIGINAPQERISAQDAIKQLNDLPYFAKGKNGSILSIGCYSECWDRENKNETLKLLKILSSYGNYIQIATKQFICEEEVLCINELCNFKNQIGIYFSIPTYQMSEKMEFGTASPEQRLLGLKYCDHADNLYSALYIKPVLHNITIYDLPYFKNILSNTNCLCVVGPQFSYSDAGNVIIGDTRFTELIDSDVDYIYNELMQLAPNSVFTHSTEIIEYFRGY